MIYPFSPAALIGASLIGGLSAYLAYRRGKSPYLWFFIGFFFGALGILFIFFSPKPKPVPAEEPAPIIPTIQGPKDKFWYYLDALHQQQGPMSHDALTAAWREGKLNLSTYVWNEELPEWKPLEEFVKS